MRLALHGASRLHLRRIPLQAVRTMHSMKPSVNFKPQLRRLVVRNRQFSSEPNQSSPGEVALELVPYGLGLAAFGAAYMTTDKALADSELGLRFKNQMDLTKEVLSGMVSKRKINNFRGAALENFSIQVGFVYSPHA